MNYFAHGRRFVDDPYLLAGTAVPDWLRVSDPRTRVRLQHALPGCDAADDRCAAVARGIAQHHRDDSWFHSSGAFNVLQYQMAVQVREAVGADDSLRPSFLGHILVEILLDASLIAQSPGRLDAYYAALESVDAALVERTVRGLAPRPCERLGVMIHGFCRERFLFDYLDDEKLTFRLNQVMRRVGLNQLPPQFTALLPSARQQVAAAAEALVTEHLTLHP